jgi:hypothetical protein
MLRIQSLSRTTSSYSCSKLGWTILASVRNSALKLSSEVGSMRLSTLIATVAPRAASSARYTTPDPPVPRQLSIAKRLRGSLAVLGSVITTPEAAYP